MCILASLRYGFYVGCRVMALGNKAKDVRLLKLRFLGFAWIWLRRIWEAASGLWVQAPGC